MDGSNRNDKDEESSNSDSVNRNPENGFHMDESKMLSEQENNAKQFAKSNSTSLQIAENQNPLKSEDNFEEKSSKFIENTNIESDGLSSNRQSVQVNDDENQNERYQSHENLQREMHKQKSKVNHTDLVREFDDNSKHKNESYGAREKINSSKFRESYINDAGESRNNQEHYHMSDSARRQMTQYSSEKTFPHHQRFYSSGSKERTGNNLYLLVFYEF